MFPEGSFSVDAEIEDTLQTLVQWGYLAQPEEFHGQAYLLTPAGLNYAARKYGSVWDGTERRQQERRSGRGDPPRVDQRRTERRQEEQRAS